MTATATRNCFLLLIMAALTYGALGMTRHAREAHAGEAWQPPDIAQVLDGKQGCGLGQEIHIRRLQDGREAHYCAMSGGAIGLIIAAGVVITGFFASMKYWSNCR
jgi:hypothetical protein